MSESAHQPVRPRYLEAVEELLGRWYRPEEKIRLGILLVNDAFADALPVVDRHLLAAGHQPLRRLARIQPRRGEAGLRTEDVAEFVTLYGHEYSLLVASPTRPDGTGELDPWHLTECARRAGVSVIWDLAHVPTAVGKDAAGWGADAVLRADGTY